MTFSVVCAEAMASKEAELVLDCDDPLNFEIFKPWQDHWFAAGGQFHCVMPPELQLSQYQL